MRVFLGDLAHYTIKLTNNHTPLNIGFIAAYLKSQVPSAEIKLYKDPARLVKDIEQNPPDVLALSNYVWCQSVSEDVFKFYKKFKKDGVTVWGGPNFPMNELHKARKYLVDRPYVDFYIPYEGETPFYNIVKAIAEHGHDVQKLKKDHQACFDGSHFLSPAGELIGNKIGLQIPDINLIPSPYLEGWMDQFLHEGLHAMFETQRGCPYKCTFCHTGLDYYSRGRTFSLDRCKKEVEYITSVVPDPTKTHLYITDSNFGMWPQDLEFAKWLNEYYVKTGFPLSFGTSTGKGQVHRVLATVMSHPKLMLTNSVQSLDDKVLKAIKRKNLPMDQLKFSQGELDAQGKLSQPEIILGLPEEDRESHLSTLRKLIHDIQANIIYQYTLMLLPGTEIYTDEMRKEHQYMVKYRLLPTSFGEYAGTRSFEVEEVSVQTKNLSFQDYLEMREMFFFVHNVYSNSIYRLMMRYLQYLGGDVINLFLYMMKKRKTLGAQFPNKVLSDYIRDTQEELFDSKEALVEFLSEDKNYKDLLDGRRGINLTHTYRTVVLLNSKEWIGFITRAFEEYIRDNHNESFEVMDIVRDINQHINIQAECQYRYFKDKKNIPSSKKSLSLKLEYDILVIFAKKIDKQSVPIIEKEKVTYRYYMKDEAIKYIQSFSENERTVDLALTVLRMDQSYLFPVCQREANKVLVNK